MNPDKNHPNKTRSDQNTNEPVSNQQGSNYRPDWIIPDNGSSSRNPGRSSDQQQSQQDNGSIPLDNDETLGIP